LVQKAHQELTKPLRHAKRKGPQGQNCTYSSDTVLRLYLVKVLEDLTFRGTVVRVDDSPRLRDFTRIYNGPMMDPSTLCRLVNALRPKTWRALNDLLRRSAAKEGRITGEQERIDGTAVETNIHWPTDSGMLWDTYRVLARLVRQIREIHPAISWDKRLHDRRAKKLHGQIARASQHKSGKAKKKQKGLYERLIGLVAGILDWMPSFCERVLREAPRAGVTALELVKIEALVKEIGDYLSLGHRVVDQSRRRVILGEQVPNDEKIFSIFEPHTELLKRGRAGKPVEFGHMIYLQQVDGCFITGYGVYEKRPVEHELVEDAIEDHRELFGHYPKVFAADKGFWQDSKARELLRLKVPTVSICKKGKRTEAEEEYEHGVLFRLAQRFRAGIEGSISFLKRVFGLGRCINKGFEHFEATVGATVFAHNLLVLTRGAG
jgi:IS5 family transposase